jgi:hypothetical protein
MEYEKVHLFIDPITTDTTFTDSGYENETYTGKMMLLVSSNIDETYADKYADSTINGWCISYYETNIHLFRL